MHTRYNTEGNHGQEDENTIFSTEDNVTQVVLQRKNGNKIEISGFQLKGNNIF